MGFFDFALDIGSKLFGSEDEAPDKIKAHIEEANPGVSNLAVKVENGVAMLSGQADSAEAMEKAVLMAPAAEQEVQYYEIQSGNSLSAIAKQFYGNAADYPRIFEANREVIKDADLIYPGQKIRIPK